MKFKITTTIIACTLLLSCQDTKPDNNKHEQEDIYDDTVSEKKSYYQTIMHKKTFSLEKNGPCDDALDDTLHKRYIAYIDSTITTSSKTEIEFRFKDACCQEFLGDYNIKEDTLLFEFEHVNNEVCSCICWYRYKLVIRNIKHSFNEIVIRRKK